MFVDIIRQADKSDLDETMSRVVDQILAPGDDPRQVLILGTVQPGESGEAWWKDLAPPVIRVRDEFEDPARKVDAHLDALAGATGRWSVPDAAGGFGSPAEWLKTAMQTLAERTNVVAPDFVTSKGEVAIRLAPPGAQGEPRTVVGLLKSDSGQLLEWTDLGAGTRRWIAAAVEEACRPQPRGSDATWTRAPLYIVDEPELHLHPTAQQSILRWLEDRVRAGAAVLIATHSHSFIDVDVADRHLLGLLAGPGGTRLLDLTEDLLGDLAPKADSLLAGVGLDRAAPIALTRGVLFVEGEHDRLVIRRFFGATLDRERIRVVPIRGTSNAMSLAEAELFAVLGVPLCVLFDGIRANAIRGQPPDDLSGEEAKLRRLLDHFEHLAHEGHEIGWVEFNVPDVIAALPMLLVRRAYPEVVANDWSAITEQWAESERPSFKPFALKALGLKRTSTDDFVNAVLRIAREDDVPSSDLLRAVKEAVAWLTRPSLRSEDEDHRR